MEFVIDAISGCDDALRDAKSGDLLISIDVL